MEKQAILTNLCKIKGDISVIYSGRKQSVRWEHRESLIGLTHLIENLM